MYNARAPAPTSIISGGFSHLNKYAGEVLPLIGLRGEEIVGHFPDGIRTLGALNALCSILQVTNERPFLDVIPGIFPCRGRHCLQHLPAAEDETSSLAESYRGIYPASWPGWPSPRP